MSGLSMWGLLGSWVFLLVLVVAVGAVLFAAARRRGRIVLGAAAGGYLLASIALAVTLSTSATVGEGHVSCGDPVLDGLTAEPLDPVTAAELKVEGLADSSDECRSAARARYSWAVGGYVALAAAGTTLLARRRTVAAR